MIRYDSAQRYFNQAYILRQTLPDFHQEVARWVSLGEDLDKTLAERRWSAETLRYGEHPRQDIRLYRANLDEVSKGLAVFIHGGFWRMMDRSQSHFVAQPYLERGWDCAIIEYRLMPEFRLAQLVHDTAAALQKLDSQRQWPQRLLAGHSAGAHLAWHGGLAARSSGASSANDALLLVSPVFDIFAVAATPIIDELEMSAQETAQWSCYHGFAQADQAVQFVVGTSETEDFKRQAYMGAQMMGLAEKNNIALIEDCNHLSLMTQLAINPPLFEQLHHDLGIDFD